MPRGWDRAGRAPSSAFRLRKVLTLGAAEPLPEARPAPRRGASPSAARQKFKGIGDWWSSTSTCGSMWRFLEQVQGLLLRLLLLLLLRTNLSVNLGQGLT